MNPICVADSERTLAGDHMIVYDKPAVDHELC
jgi:hypothetical protein